MMTSFAAIKEGQQEPDPLSQICHFVFIPFSLKFVYIELILVENLIFV